MPESGADRSRLFFAIQPDVALRQQMARLARSLPLQRQRLTHPEDLHATLAFLGMVDEEHLPCLLDAAAQVRCEPFSLQLDSLEYWSRPKVAVMGASEVPAGNLRLLDRLWNGVAACGFQREQRPYRPHITLARRGGRIERGRLEPPLLWQVDEFVLMQSLSEPEPPRYKVVERWSLVGNQG